MNYEERLTCFIDLLGFKSAIDQSVDQAEVRKALHDAIHELKSDNLRNQVYDGIPCFLLDRKGTVKPFREVKTNDLRSQVAEAYPITITQFSDSFVLSCPASNHASCDMLLKCVYLIHMIYFWNLGMMVRGGLSIGKLIHEENGALFGPAMNEAYALESKSAVYPRVVISQQASVHLDSMLSVSATLAPFKKSFDGQCVFDLVSIFAWPGLKECEPDKIDKQLAAIEADVLEHAKAAHPKVAYLKNEWEQFKLQS